MVYREIHVYEKNSRISNISFSGLSFSCFVKFIAWLFSKKTSRYCHSPGGVGSGGVQKL